MAQQISPKGIIRQRSETRYTELKGRDPSDPKQRVNISGPAYDLSKKIGEWLDDTDGTGAGKSFNGLGSLEVEIYLQETLLYVREQAFLREQQRKVEAKEERQLKRVKA